jgi:hypothetical protein
VTASRAAVPGGPLHTGNLRPVNGLASFDNVVDCVAANNRLKRPQGPNKANSGLRWNWLQHQNQDHLLDAKPKGRFARGKCSATAWIEHAGNWESDERDIRNKI